ncbi:hypothetical protein EVAR_6273_1 [Eumeta japonica]|uniref:Uncharacterized protein n=1 Tax=Eumeta variegata TaxID=151549 RepID=A0A4C1T896_EUMVA|nr:hypothetical protein EVAR_6273_1 [Eumeta japonica]
MERERNDVEGNVEWATGTITLWTKCNSRDYFFTGTLVKKFPKISNCFESVRKIEGMVCNASRRLEGRHSDSPRWIKGIVLKNPYPFAATSDGGAGRRYPSSTVLSQINEITRTA